MTALPPDPLERGGVPGFARRLRAGETTAEAAARACLERIEALDGRLGAFEHVATAQALAAARGVDRLLEAGTDLGPLMGVPVALKDLFAIDGMPTTAGSRVDVSDLVGGEGAFVKALKRAGCVIVGKTRTVEFALGASGVNVVRGTPWNPWDGALHRAPGGSSSGSAVAVAAGMAGFAIGSDTGGSVRIPAALTGVFGLKTTVGLFPTDGIFPLSPTLDTVGPLCRGAADAVAVFEALTGGGVAPRQPSTLRLGKPTAYFYDDLDDDVALAMDDALARLRGAGVEIVEIEVPEVRERTQIMPRLLCAELLAGLGRGRFERQRARMDPLVAERAASALELSAIDYLTALHRQRELARLAARHFDGLDGWVTPTVPMTAPPVEQALDPELAPALTARINRNTQPGNLLGLCAASLPVRTPPALLPTGLQILAPGGREASLLGTSLAVERTLGGPHRPELSAFVS